jgi:MFS family permease
MATTMTRNRRIAFSTMLVIAMASATFAAASLGILASFIIDDLGITRAQLGIALGVINVGGAVLSPVAGRITDRIGGKRAMIALFVASAATFLIFGFAFAYVMLIVGAFAAAFSQATANPSTNKLIAEDLAAGERGVITGIKQSGVQAGIFLGGLIVPSLALTFGWRGAYLFVAAVPLVFVGLAVLVFPTAEVTSAEQRSRDRGRLPAAIWWLAGYGFLLGFSGAVTYLVPLFAEETLGMSPVAGGIAAAVIAFTAVPGRILWSRYAERSGAFHGSLGTMAALSVAAALLFYGAGAGWAWLLWPAAVLIAAGSSSWNSVGMLAVMIEAGTASTGRASGVVLFGFLAGLGIAPPIFGAIIDRTGSYDLMWLLSAVSSLGAGATIIAWGRSRGRHP